MISSASHRRRAPVACALFVVLISAGCGEAPPPPPSTAVAKAGEAAEAQWTVDYDGALRRAAAEKKRILAAFTGSDWCPPCHKLAAEVFQTPEFRRWAARHFILVEFDFPRRTPIEPAVKARNESFARLLGVTGFPTVVVLDADGREQARLGYRPGGAEPWIAELERLLAR
jgi:protein disulfide-isomerase